MVSDICSILRGNIKYPFSISDSERKKIKFDLISNQYFSSYIRLNVSDKKGVLYNITKIFSNHSVSIKRLIQNPTKSKKNSSIVIITHKAKDQNLMKVVKNLSKENYLIKQPKLIRIED